MRVHVLREKSSVGGRRRVDSLHLFRGIERILIVLGGIISIMLGAWLFSRAELRENSGGSFKSTLFSITSTKVSPGVFFAAFDAWILVTPMNTVATSYSEEVSSSPQKTTAQILGGENGEKRLILGGENTAQLLGVSGRIEAAPLGTLQLKSS